VVPLGTEAVDYPDFAYAVARLVAEGRAWRGIVVDGAGIGSCMAANKVPGVRAAMCYDHPRRSTRARHNDANVLTLGGIAVGPKPGPRYCENWLATDFGGGRHARRVDKIGEIEKAVQEVRVSYDAATVERLVERITARYSCCSPTAGSGQDSQASRCAQCTGQCAQQCQDKVRQVVGAGASRLSLHAWRSSTSGPRSRR